MISSSAALCYVLLTILLTACATDIVSQRGADRRKLVNVNCAPKKSSFFTNIFMDIEVNKEPELEELYQLEGAFKDTYNQYSRENYCDVLFREVFDAQIEYYDQVDERTQRYILLIEGKCRGCDETADLFSKGNRRGLESLTRRSLGMGKDVATSCSCPVDVGFGIPSIEEFTTAVKGRILQLIQQNRLNSVLSVVQVVEIVPVPCGEETEFTSNVLVSFGSTNAEFNSGDLALLPQGFRSVYNEIQQDSCDSQFRRVDVVDATVVDTRRLGQFHEEGRDLQLNFFRFLNILNLASRGRCRGCPKSSRLFNDASRRELVARRQSGLCFCAAGKTGPDDSEPPSTEAFRMSYNTWIDEQRQLGNLQDIVSAEGVVQVDETAPSVSPSTIPSNVASMAPSPIPSSSPSGKPSLHPSSEPSRIPTVSPSESPTVSPSESPTVSPSESPSVSPSESPSALPTPSPSERPSFIPTLTPSSAPSSVPSAKPSLPPSSLPTENPSTIVPTIMPTTPSPSAAPSFSTLCSSSEIDTQLVYQTFEDGNVRGWENVKLDSSEPSFTTFLGRFQSGDAFPAYTANFSTLFLHRMYFSFVFFEIDSWDGNGPSGIDTLSMRIDGENNLVDSIQFGHFKGTYSEKDSSGNSTRGLIQYSIDSEPIERSPQGFLPAPDQKHTILIGIPLIFYKATGSVKLTIAWSLVGEKDEFVGIDNFKVTACIDATPSQAPSTQPSISSMPSRLRTNNV